MKPFLFQRLKYPALATAVLLCFGSQAANAGRPLRFAVTFDTTLQTELYTGRVYVMLTTEKNREPRLALNWFQPPPIFAVDVENVNPTGTIILDSTALAFPVPLNKLPAGHYRVQAVARRSLDSPVPGKGPGDLYSAVQDVEVSPASGGNIAFRLDQMVSEKPFEASEHVKLVEIISPALSAFHHREFKLRAAVSLPESWRPGSGQSFPVVYYITGFGGSHRSVERVRRMMGELATQAIVVVPDASNHYGHSVFANSENTGPWGTALTTELIPYIEKKYNRVCRARNRYVTGVSSGGWSSLWLQIAYPDSFSGCWSIVPDPVDFRDFQRIDLYAPGANMYKDEQGERRPLARYNGRVAIWYDDFVRLESVLGPGGQIHSFEAVFSPKGADGEPRLVFDRRTGAVDPQTAEFWRRYDINLILQRNWPQLEPKLRGKLHIFAGGMDTFYLEGAVRLLKKTLAQLNSDAEVEIIPGMIHQAPPGVFDAMLKRIRQERSVENHLQEPKTEGRGNMR